MSCLFQEASEEKQLEKVKHWAAMKDSQQAKQIAEFPLEFGNQLRELKRLQEVLTIQKARFSPSQISSISR